MKEEEQGSGYGVFGFAGNEMERACSDGAGANIERGFGSKLPEWGAYAPCSGKGLLAAERIMDYIEAGKIVNTHGIKGELRVQPWVDSADFLKRFSHFLIDGKGYGVSGGRTHKSFFIAKLENVDDVNSAMTFKNKVVFVDKAEAGLPEGSFFIQDILGASVREEAGRELGILTDVLDSPASRVYVVTGEREILIPAVPEFILRTDVNDKIITVRLIDGM